MRFPVVLFDFDGTLVDTVALIMASYRHAFLEVVGEPRPEDEVRRRIGRTLMDYLESVAPDHADELARVYTDYNRAHYDMVTGFPGVPEVIAGLTAAGVRTGVVTSRKRPSTVDLLAQVGLGGALPVLVAGEETEGTKPDPAPLRRALELLGADPAAAAYVGDSVVDVQAAHAAGVTPIAVTWGAGTPAELAAENPAHLVTTAQDLAALLAL